MKTVSSKVDNSLHEKIQHRCDGRGCSPSQYIKQLIQRDLADDESKDDNRQEVVIDFASNHIPHNGNPAIKLVREIIERGEKRYVDTDGQTWRMKRDRTLIGIARIVS